MIFGLLIILNPTQFVFAERNFSLEKIVDINKETLEESLTDLNAFPKIFPENVKSVKLIQNDEKTIAEMVLGFSGFSINSQVEVNDHPDSRHTIEVISRDLRGTKLTTSLTKTWSYSGVPDEGTIVEMDMTLKTSGFLALAGLAPDETIVYSLDRSLVDIVSYIKSEPEKEEISEETTDEEPIEEKPKKPVKKRSFKR